MTVTRTCLENYRLKDVRQGGLGDVIRNHKSARRKIDNTIDAVGGDAISNGRIRWLDDSLQKAAQDEEAARLTFLGYRVTCIEDVRAKADHVRLLLAEGDELDKNELDLLLHSII